MNVSTRSPRIVGAPTGEGIQETEESYSFNVLALGWLLRHVGYMFSADELRPGMKCEVHWLLSGSCAKRTSKANCKVNKANTAYVDKNRR